MKGQKREKCPMAIVCDIDHKQFILKVLCADRRTVVIADDKKSRSIWFPEGLVCTLDGDLFGRLKLAYTSGKTDLLDNLGSVAQPYEPESEG